jgi:hypothetical protein
MVVESVLRPVAASVLTLECEICFAMAPWGRLKGQQELDLLAKSHACEKRQAWHPTTFCHAEHATLPHPTIGIVGSVEVENGLVGCGLPHQIRSRFTLSKRRQSHP